MPKGPRHKIKAASLPPRHHQIEPRYLPATAAADWFGVSYQTIWRALKEGRLKSVTIGKRKLVDLSSAQP
jgi:hypothetical protein